MGAITIRRLDEALIERIKQRASAAGRSMEEESRLILAQGVGLMTGPQFMDHMRRRRIELCGDRVFPDSTPLIREMREEDPTVSPPDAYQP